MLKNKEKSIYSPISNLVVVLLLVVFTFNIVNIRVDIRVQIFLYWIIAGLTITAIILRNKIDIYVFALLFFSLYIMVLTFFNQSMNLSTFYITFGYMTLWIWVIILFTFANEQNEFNINCFDIISLFSIVMGIYIILNYQDRKLALDFGFVNSNYYLLCAIPIILLARRKWIKFPALIIACATVLFSMKRTGIAALLSSMFFIILYYARKNAHFRLKAFFASILFVLIFLNYNAIVDWMGIDFFHRFTSLEQDGGSGRSAIYQNCMETLRNGGIIKLLFGSGYNGFIKYYGSEVSCHNDILEVLIDYGLFGLVFYLFIIFRYIKNCIYCIKSCMPIAEACIASLCAFVFITMFGHCVLYPSYFMFLLIFWVYVEKQVKNHIEKH